MFLRTTPRYSSKALNSNGFPRMDAASSEATQTGDPLSILNRTDIRIDYARAWARRGHPFGSPRRSGSRKISSSCLLEFFEPDQRATIRGDEWCCDDQRPAQKKLCPIGGRDEVRVPRVAISGTGSEAIHDHQLSFMLHYWPVQCAPRFGDALRGST